MHGPPDTQPPPSGSIVPAWNDEIDSGALSVAEQAVLILTKPGEDTRAVASLLSREGYLVVPLPDAQDLERLGFMPRYAVVDASLPGGLEAISGSVGDKQPLTYSVALLDAGETESSALRRGAQLTLRRPVDPEDVLLCLKRFQQCHDLVAASREIFEREPETVSEPLVEGILAAVAHEIQNPLAIALGNVELVADADTQENASLSMSERGAALGDALDALRRITGLVRSVTGLVRGGTPELSKVTLLGVAEDALKNVDAPKTQIEVKGTGDVVGWAHPLLLQQVVTNLVRNAIDATRDTVDPAVLVRVYATGTEARISVRDNGPGIPPSLRERIFEPFVTTKGAAGTGLGLALARHAAARMGGTLTVGASDKGAVFRVRLRRAESV